MARPQLRPGEWGEVSIGTAGKGGRIRARVRYRTPKGEMVQVEAHGKTETEAKRRLKARVREWQPEEGRLRVRDIASQWLKDLEARGEVRPQSLANYERAYRTTLSPLIGARNVGNITAGMLEEMLDEIFITKPGMYGPSMTVAHGVFSFAHRRGLIEANPMTSIRRRKGKAGIVKVLTLDELAILRGLIREWQAGPRRIQPLLDVIDLALSTGARIGELLAVQWDQVDLDAGELVLDSTQVWIKGKGIVDQGSTKEGKRLRIKLTEFALVMLRARRGAYPEAKYVFESKAGTMIARANLDRAWRSARSEEFEWVTWKTFRKSVATLAAREVDTATAAKVLGHTRDSVTRAHYIAQGPETVPDMTAVLEALAGDKLSFDDDD